MNMTTTITEALATELRKWFPHDTIKHTESQIDIYTDLTETSPGELLIAINRGNIYFAGLGPTKDNSIRAIQLCDPDSIDNLKQAVTNWKIKWTKWLSRSPQS